MGEVTRPDLEAYALLLAEAAALRSEDPHRKVGAAILGEDGRVMATGYNGPPAGIDFEPALWGNREYVRAYTLHAEANALRYVLPGEGWVLASTLEPCLECLKAARAQGIRRVIFHEYASGYWTRGAAKLTRLYEMDVRRV